MDGEKYKVGTSHDSISSSNDRREPYKKLQMSDDIAITSNQQCPKIRPRRFPKVAQDTKSKKRLRIDFGDLTSVA